LVGARAYLASGAPLKDFPRPIWFPGLTADSWIMKTPGTCSGRACIRLTRISVSDLVERWDLGCTDADILEQLPALDQGDLDTARDYARQHPEEIARAIWLNQTWVEGHGGEPAAIAPILAEGRRLGLTDATISTVFDPPLTPELLTRADALLAAQPGGGV
jgi:uncharacterized protein (DUF433 family)